MNANHHFNTRKSQGVITNKQFVNDLMSSEEIRDKVIYQLERCIKFVV